MKGNKGLLLLIVALIAGGLLALYFGYYGGKATKKTPLQEAAKQESLDLKQDARKVKEGSAQSPATQDPQEKLEEVLGGKYIKTQAMKAEDTCQKIESDLVEFFTYLEARDYVREMGIKGGMLSRFQDALHDLSLSPPVPAGEGLNYDMIIKNIYHFYRVLGLQNLKLARLILKNEADSMEINLALFYQWLISTDQCTYSKTRPPSLDVIYMYAGFLVNSIGGRAYLFRRETRLRLLISYYCILIIHEADRKKMNNFGIDITPFLEPLAEEIENYRPLYFRREYAGKLIDLKNYYANRRKVS